MRAAKNLGRFTVRVAPAEESPQLDLAAALQARGHHHAAHQVLHTICNRGDNEDEAPEDLPDRSHAIIAQHEWLGRPPARATA